MTIKTLNYVFFDALCKLLYSNNKLCIDALFIWHYSNNCLCILMLYFYNFIEMQNYVFSMLNLL